MHDDLDDSVVQGLFLAAAGLEDWEISLSALANEIGALACEVVTVQIPSRRVVEHHGSRDQAQLFLPGAVVMEPAPKPAASMPIDTAAPQLFSLVQSGNEAMIAAIRWSNGAGAAVMPAVSRRRFERYLAHLKGAAEAAARYRRLRWSGCAATQLVEQSTRPTLLIDEHSRIIARNPAAKTLLQAAQVLTEAAGVLKGCTVPGQTALLRAVQAAGRHSREGVRPRRRAIRLNAIDGSPAMGSLLDVTPRAFQVTGRPAMRFLVWISPTQQLATADVDFLKQLFEFTAAEAEVAVLLAQGQDVAAIAQARQTSVMTVRVQVRYLLQKTSTRRQVDLIRLLISVLR